ncbi:MAG: hypothetical protein LC725_04690, partial [Lentisphaerae bacterium]|nr:hypothetical protein [Lentisphaerota bacterium]
LYIKRIILHPHLPRLLFNLTNTFWDKGDGEPRVRQICTIGLNGEDPVCVGPCVHHPNWHPLENRLVANLHDFTRTMRFGLYPGDGKGLLEYIPKTKGSGHPSFSPDGRWLCTDASGVKGNQMILCDPRNGASIVLVDGTCFSAPYASFKAIDERKAGETIMDALHKAQLAKNWQTQGHPAWSRDGSAILFNRDLGSGSQLFMVDVAGALAGVHEKQ